MFLISLERKILSINDTVTKTLGYNPQELICKTLDSVIQETHSTTIERGFNDKNEKAPQDEIKNTDITLKTKKGIIVHSSIATSPVRDNNGNISPDKKLRKRRIDGAVAMLISYSVYLDEKQNYLNKLNPTLYLHIIFNLKFNILMKCNFINFYRRSFL